MGKKLESNQINTFLERSWHLLVINTAQPFARQFQIKQLHAFRRQDLISIASGSSTTSTQTADSRCKVKLSKLANQSSLDILKLPSTSELTALRNTRTTSAVRMRFTATITQPKTRLRTFFSRLRGDLQAIFHLSTRKIITYSFSRHRLILHMLGRLRIFRSLILEIL